MAKKLSAVLGRRIEHVKLPGDERYQDLVSAGVSDGPPGFLPGDGCITTGVKAGMNDEWRQWQAGAQRVWISWYRNMSPPGCKSRAGRVGTCIRSMGAS